MDLLADMVSRLALRSTLYFRAVLGSPFAVAVPEDRLRIRFHVASRGRGWIGLPSGEGAWLERGDLVLVPHGSAHVLANAPTGEPEAPALDELVADADHRGVVVHVRRQDRPVHVPHDDGGVARTDPPGHGRRVEREHQRHGGKAACGGRGQSRSRTDAAQ